MLFTAISFRWKDETRDHPTPQYQRILNRSRTFGMMDDNIDELLQREEIRGWGADRILASFDRLDMNGDGGLDRNEFAMIYANRGRQGDD